MQQILKMALYICGGGLAGAIFPMLFFVDENSTNRLVPAWGIFLMSISGLIGALASGVVYYQLFVNKKSLSNDEHT
jgi:uncharacterized membrane protein YeaQ/YmgE (transglycosylase-associated protein family)